MKKFKIISNIIIILLLASGAVPCIISSVDHAKNCYACSSHSSHPQIEIMLYGLVVLLAGVLFGISRIIPRLFKKNNAFASTDTKSKIKLHSQKITDIAALAVLVFGLVNYAVLLICESLRYCQFDFLTASTLLVVLIPYALVAGLILGVNRVILSLIIK